MTAYLGLNTQVHDELVQRIFPGMALMTPEPYCTAELWSLMQLLPYRIRFEVYDAAQVSTAVPWPLLELHRLLALVEANPQGIAAVTRQMRADQKTLCSRRKDSGSQAAEKLLCQACRAPSGQ